MKLLAAAAAAAMLACAPALGDEVVDATSPDRLLPFFAKFGSAELDRDDVGDPMIRGNINGIKYLVSFYGCTDNAACKNLTFTASWDVAGVTPETINEWNRAKRFGKAFLDVENDPVIQMSVNLDFGVTGGNFEDTVDWWRVVLGQFEEDVINR